MRGVSGVTCTGQTIKCGGPRHHRRDPGCKPHGWRSIQMRPMHCSVLGVYLTTGRPKGPCWRSVQMRPMHCSVFPRPISSASRAPVYARPSPEARMPITHSYMNRTPSCGMWEGGGQEGV
eukprot:226635-Prorocentrum_minimum.AAC.1